MKTPPARGRHQCRLDVPGVSDRTRLRILHVLQGGELCVGDIVEVLQAPQPKFRSRPLWFWNNTAVTAAEVEEQLQGNRDRSGYGGMAPLPFGPKFTPKYLSEEYFTLYGAAVRKSRELGMFLTIYDEYGFPSGSGGANMGDGIPRFKNKYPGCHVEAPRQIRRDRDGSCCCIPNRFPPAR